MYIRQEGIQGQRQPAEVTLKLGRTSLYLSSCVSSEKSQSRTSGNFYTSDDFQSERCQSTEHIYGFVL